jgi:hypothetical protein
MAMLIKNILNSQKCLVSGKIKDIVLPEKNKGQLAIVNFEDNTSVFFWNNYTGNLKDRLINSNAKVGDTITVLTTPFAENKFNAINFKFSGEWTFTEEHPVSRHGTIMDIFTEGDTSSVILESGDMIEFTNLENGYQFANRLISAANVGDKIAVTESDGKVTNFKVRDKWEIEKSLTALVGQVAFIDHGTYANSEKPFVRINLSIYKGRDADGKTIYDNKYVFFDNRMNENMLMSIEKKLKQKTKVVLVCGKSPTKDDTYNGYFFKLI